MPIERIYRVTYWTTYMLSPCGWLLLAPYKRPGAWATEVAATRPRCTGMLIGKAVVGGKSLPELWSKPPKKV